jgi:hypothetical protein
LDEEEYARQKEYYAKKLAEFDDDVEKDREEFYRDPDRWWQRRQREREREFEWDHRDRLAENEEYEFAREKYEDNQRMEVDVVPEENKEVEMEVEPQPEEPAVPEGFTVGRIMTKEERVRAIQELVARIPSEKEALWEYQVAWEYLDRVIDIN